MEASFFSILIFLLSRSLPSSLSVPALTWCASALSFFLLFSIFCLLNLEALAGPAARYRVAAPKIRGLAA